MVSCSLVCEAMVVLVWEMRGTLNLSVKSSQSAANICRWRCQNKKLYWTVQALTLGNFLSKRATEKETKTSHQKETLGSEFRQVKPAGGLGFTALSNHSLNKFAFHKIEQGDMFMHLGRREDFLLPFPLSTWRNEVNILVLPRDPPYSFIWIY